ncbi:hypothetical protein CUMW_120100 [Citrus unshiu]|uniref:Transmembrane protein n=1 Tax=Citrus unshiu TaxID=55188 RepID=A0A2H5PB21_CITUN|nr:hypothetical protein CUMW_120100 [Citrus unshiu]
MFDYSSLNLSHSVFNSLILRGVAVITFTVRLCLFHHSSASASLVSSLTLSRPAKEGGFRGCVLWPVGVDFAAVFCGLWGWISRNLRKAIRVQNPESGNLDFFGLNPDRTRMKKIGFNAGPRVPGVKPYHKKRIRALPNLRGDIQHHHNF